MCAPVRMLLWELWGRNRAMHIAMLVSLLLWVLAIRAIPEVKPDLPILTTAILKMLSSILYALPPLAFLVYPLIMAAHALEQMETKRPGLPERFLTLPLPTWLLVAVPLTVCLLLMALMGGVIVWAFGNPGGQIAWWYGFVIITGAVWILVLDWVLAPARPLQMLLVLVIGSLLIASAIVPVEDPSDRYWIRLFTVVPIVLLLVGLLALFIGMAEVRRGDTGGGSALAPAIRRLERSPRRGQDPFPSPSAAQVWYETRSLPRLALAFGSLQILVACFLGVARVFSEGTPTTQDLLGILRFQAFGFPVVLSIGIGSMLAVTASGSTNFALASIQSVRPLSDTEIAHTKLKAGLKLLLTVVAIAMISALLHLLAFVGIREATDLLEPLVAVTVAGLWLVLLWTLMGWTFSITISNSRMVMLGVVSICTVLFFTPLALLASTDTGDSSPLLLTVRALIALALLCPLMLSAWAFHSSVQRGLVLARLLVRAAMVWIPLAVALLLGAWLALPVGRFWPEMWILGPLLLIVLPLAPLATTPIAVFRNRHGT